MKNAKEWVRGLPLADPGDAAKSLIAKLEEWNRQTVPPKQRFVALEALTGTASRILDTLRRNLRDVTFPLASRSFSVAESCDTLCCMLVEGYEKVVSDCEAGERIRIGARFVSLWQVSAQRVFYHARTLVGERKRLNMRSDDGLWSRLHGLYRLSRREGVESNLLPLPSGDKGRASIEMLYKQALLLYLIPFQELRYEQRREIEETLSVWADLLRVRECDATEKEDTVDFVIDYFQDQGPIRFAGNCGKEGEGQWLLLDVRRLLLRLKRLRRRANEASTPRVVLDDDLTASARTLAVLSRACKPDVSRKEERFAVDEPVEVFFTFSGMHYHLASAPDADEEEAIEYSHLIVDSVHNENGFSSLRPISREAFCPPAQARDISDHGIRIEFASSAELAIRVGDVAAVRRIDESLPRIGQIRWLEVIGSGKMAAGIAFWCGRPRRATLAAKSSDGNKAMLPAVLGLHLKSGKTLLAVSYIPGIHKKRLNLVVDGHRLPIKLDRRPVESSQAFAAYPFSIPAGWENGRQRMIEGLSLEALDRLLKLSH